MVLTLNIIELNCLFTGKFIFMSNVVFSWFILIILSELPLVLKINFNSKKRY
jgi:hypothetical protein